MSPIKTPNFFIIGAPKCGTTSLAAWLAEHPQIYMSPIKEPYYFSTDLNHRVIEKWQEYLELFAAVNPKHIAVGEASTTYLFSKVAVPNIEQQIPNSRYIVLIRNPVEMAYSLHDQRIRSLHENINDFTKAWNLSPERRIGNHAPIRCDEPLFLDYQSWCKLGEQIERLYKSVPRERVLVLVLEDLKKEARQQYLRVLNFLDVPDDKRMSFPVYNSSREWRSLYLGKFVRGLGKWITWARYTARILPSRGIGTIGFLEKLSMRQHPRSHLPVKFRAELKSYYEEDLHKLEKLLERNFSSWYDRNQSVHGP